MLRKFPLSLLLWALLACVLSASAADPLSGRLEALQRSHQALRADAGRRVYRHHWQNLIGKLEALLKADPPADPALEARIRYTLGTAWRDLYDQSRNKADLEPARQVFAGMVKCCPDNPLSDDALYQLGEITWKLGDAERARQHLLRILQDYPDGNRIDEAQFLLEKIPVQTAGKSGEERAGTPPPAPASSGEGKPAGESAAVGKPAGESAEKEALEGKSAATEAKPEGRAVRGEAAGVKAGAVSALKVWTNPDYTRLVLHLTDRVTFQHTLESPDKGAARLVIDLPEAKLEADFEKTLIHRDRALVSSASGGVLHSLAFEPRKEGGIRAVLAVERLRDYRVTPFIEPHRLLIDLFGEIKLEESDDLEKLVMNLPAKAGEKGGNAPAGAKSSAKTPAYTIVIDAGHGGEDPGAAGPTGAREKDITLSIAKKIKKKLSTMPDVRVIMTRSNDVFVPLDERTVIANKAQADLFISIHANASVNPNIHGIETYYLDTASDEAAEKLAARENATLKDRTDLAFILQDLVIEGNVRYSSRLANAVHLALLSQARTRYGAKKVKDHGVKTALFYVLFGAQMPCILLETAFISNPTEEAWLKSEAYQNLIADAVKAGVKRYTDETRALSRAGEK